MMDPTEKLAAAADELAIVRAKTDETRVELTQLQKRVAEAKAQLSDPSLAPTLAEVNEQLVLATLRAQTDADACALALEDVSRTAQIDPLTELPNRVLLIDRFAQAILNAKRHGTHVALMFLDLNRFKEINDTLGHATGDEVLKVVALRLASVVREADTVSRHGGDEFLILIAEVSKVSDAVQVADKIIDALGSPSRVGDHVFRLTASIGISLYPGDGEDVDVLINNADAAMYRAKKQGLGICVFHEPASAGDHVPRPRPLPSLGQPYARHEEANERLVLAATSAEELRTAAELSIRRQTEFVALLAHELRSPLAPISAAASLMGRANAAELPQMQAIIQRQVAHLSRLLGDVLEGTHQESGKFTFEPRIVDLTAILDAAVDACRPAMDTRLQHFHIRAPSVAIEVHGDPDRLTQIVTNLLNNASKYTQDGGEITLSVALTEQSIILAVSDNGIGISAASLPNVFDPFMLDTHAIGFHGTSLGIGLTVVRQLVEAHGGTIVATSAGDRRGSQFTVTLPR